MILPLVLAAFSSTAQPVKAPTFDKTSWMLVAADASTRALDVYSTHQMLENGYHELILPKAIADHTPTMAAYSGACVAGNYMAARWLTRHHHSRIAKIVLSVDIAQDSPWAIHNLFLKEERKK